MDSTDATGMTGADPFNLLGEGLISPSQAVEWLIEAGYPKFPTSRIGRWTRQGCHGVRLESILVGGGIYTSKAAIKRFFAHVAEARGKVRRRPTRARPATQDNAAIDAARIAKMDADLRAAGLLK